MSVNFLKRPYYNRWATLIQHHSLNRVRTKERNSRHPVPGGVCAEWEAPIDHGYPAFETWIKAQIAKYPKLSISNFRIRRLNLEKEFSPSNCVLDSMLRLNQMSDQSRAQHRPTHDVKKINADGVSFLETLFSPRK